MKTPVLLVFLLSCLSFAYGQETIFSETCGSIDVLSSKKVDTYTGWDNVAPITFTRTITLDGFADVRITSSSNHVWFPYDKSSDLIISNINTANFNKLKLSFDVAASKLANANVNKLNIYSNGISLPIPSIEIASTKFIPVTDIEISNAEVINLKFEYTALNNINGYRLDNFKITGEKITSEVNNQTSDIFKVIVSGKDLLISNRENGTSILIYNFLGSLVQTTKLKSGAIELDSKLTKGFYIVQAGKNTQKIIL